MRWVEFLDARKQGQSENAPPEIGPGPSAGVPEPLNQFSNAPQENLVRYATSLIYVRLPWRLRVKRPVYGSHLFSKHTHEHIDEALLTFTVLK